MGLPFISRFAIDAGRRMRHSNPNGPRMPTMRQLALLRILAARPAQFSDRELARMMRMLLELNTRRSRWIPAMVGGLCTRVAAVLQSPVALNLAVLEKDGYIQRDTAEPKHYRLGLEGERLMHLYSRKFRLRLEHAMTEPKELEHGLA